MTLLYLFSDSNITGFDSDIRSQVMKIDIIDFGGSVRLKEQVFWSSYKKEADRYVATD